jgi:hypothetical protein
MFPNTQAHLLPVSGDGTTVLCGKQSGSMRWRDDEHAASLKVCAICRSAA